MKKQLSKTLSVLKSKIIFNYSSIVERLERKDLFVLAPIAGYLIITLPYWNQVPSLDPMIIYRESSQFFSSGFAELAKTGYTLHPPFINIWNSIFFFLFGTNPIAYNLAGFTIFLLSLIGLYIFVKTVFGFRVAVLSSLLIFLNPLIIVNSLFLSNDMLLFCAIIFLFIFDYYHKPVFVSILLALLVIMKETGLAIIASYAIWKLFCLIRNSIKSKKFKIQPYAEQLLILWPAFLAYLLLKILLNVYHMTEWRDVMYNPSNQSSYQIVIDNLAHLKFINTYFTSNITNLFVYYFNWLIPAIILLTSIPLVHWLTKKASKRQKHLLVFWLFISFSYILFVFSFPTWTIVRYIIPVLPFFIILASIGLNVTFKKVSWVIPLVLIVFWFTLGNFSNLDPITNKLNKGSLKSMGESFYAIKFYDNSYERIAYNVKYFKATKNQNNLIKRIYATKTDVFVGDCIDLKLGEKIWSTNVHNKFYPGMNTDIKVRCINHWEIEKYQRLLLGKSIAVPSMDRELIIQKLNMSLKGNFKVVPI